MAMMSNQPLFLQQSSIDAWNDYQRILNSQRHTYWDYIVITASNEEQAESYSLQLEARHKAGVLPKGPEYAVLADPGGKRVGSGGATLNALRVIRERIRDKSDEAAPGFEGVHIMVIHSGGDSKRVPQYSALGKLFSPVPRVLPDGRRSTLFDELIIHTASLPARMKDGMLVLSGDVLPLFNALQIDFGGQGAAVVSMRDTAEAGSRHGVFLGDGNGYVSEFLHKLPVGELTRRGAVDSRGCVNIDTGLALLGGGVLESLYSLTADNDGVDEEKFSRYVNEDTRLSFYGDFLYPMAKASTKEKYLLEAAEGEITPSLLKCREEIWDAISGYPMRLMQLSPAMFVHFGSSAELLELYTEQLKGFRFLGWGGRVSSDAPDRGGYTCVNSLADPAASIGDGCYIEDSRIGPGAVVGKGCLISGVDLAQDTPPVPDGTAVHGLKLKGGGYVVRVYKVQDNPKLNSLWTASLYPVCGSMAEAARASLTMSGPPERNNLESLKSSFEKSDTRYILERQEQISAEVEVSRFLARARARESLGEYAMSGAAAELLENAATESGLGYSEKIRAFHYLALRPRIGYEEHERLMEKCFAALRQAMLRDGLKGQGFREDLKIARDFIDIRLPLRVNFGGAWSDTPPYCLENGGAVLNAAVSVNGLLPVNVTMKRLSEPKIVFESADAGAVAEYTGLDRLCDFGDPFDMFALHKAALLACGALPLGPAALRRTLGDILRGFGGGIYLSTRVQGIPRGSGLGTSSILAGACVKAIYGFFGLEPGSDELYNLVLSAEQIMGTGGGWQDQIGGLAPGIKLITAPRGLEQRFKVEPVAVSEKARAELKSRFVLINTAQRRLARNLLREIMGRYIMGRPDSVRALREIQRVAAIMRFELERGDIDAFAALLNEQWEFSKLLDENSTNTCIEQIFASCSDLIAGRMICGAGGGGFLQVVLRRGVTKDMLALKLNEVFGESGVEVVDCEICY